MNKTEEEDRNDHAKVELPEHVAKLVDFVPVRKYLELYGETKAAVEVRISRGHWRKGVEYNVLRGGGLWISLKGVNAWAKGL